MMNIKKENTAIDYFGYALYAFGGLGIEILLMMIESNIWGIQSNDWTLYKNIIHWTITCVIWGIFSIVLVKKIDNTNLELKDVNWSVISVIIIGSIIYTSYVWGGFKSVIELNNNGMIKFIAQYIYYAFECALIILIIAHGQKAFEELTKKYTHLPIGGFFLAMTWGLIHILTQGANTGIYACIQSVLFGMVYVVLNRNIKLSYIAITFMFML